MAKPLFSVGLPSCKEGLSLPVGFSSRETIENVARHAEDLGYYALWPNDHINTPAYVRRNWEAPPNFFDPFMCLAFAAGVTNHIKLGTAVTVVPIRNPVILAKTVMTLDHFTSGRVILGVGIGAYFEEFAAANPVLAADSPHRGDMLTEGIEALQILFSERRATYQGKYWQFEDLEMFPKPAQDPLPIWIGGNSQAGMTRAARFGQGWLSAVMPPDKIRRATGVIREEAEKYGRDGSQIVIAPQFVAQIGETNEKALATFRQSTLYEHLISLKESTLQNVDLSSIEEHNLIGTPAAILEKIARFTEAGVSHFCAISFSSNTEVELLDQMSWFAKEVIPYV